MCLPIRSLRGPHGFRITRFLLLARSHHRLRRSSRSHASSSRAHAVYRAFNTRDIVLMRQNWSATDDVSMNNPLGGTKRGWPEIRRVYKNFSRSCARLRRVLQLFSPRFRRNFLRRWPRTSPLRIHRRHFRSFLPHYAHLPAPRPPLAPSPPPRFLPRPRPPRPLPVHSQLLLPRSFPLPLPTRAPLLLSQAEQLQVRALFRA